MKIPRPLVASLAAAILALTGVISIAAPAAAHTPKATTSCSVLSIRLDSYETSSTNPKPNSVRATVDGAQVLSETFGKSFSRDVPFSDATTAHKWTVVIDALGTSYDKTLTGTSTPCAPVIVADSSAAVSVSDPTCSAPAILSLDSIKNATWGTPTATSGPANYSVTATATKGHSFKGGSITQVFTGSLAGKLDPDKAPCVVADAEAAVSVTAPSCSTAGTLVLGAVKNATWGPATATTGPADYLVTATATKGHTFSDGSTTQTFDGALAGLLDPDELPCAATNADAEVGVTPGTCTTTGTLTLGTVSFATWGTPTKEIGPGEYSVTATSVAGHLFADGSHTKVFTGTLEDHLDQTTAPCLPPQPQANIVVSVDEQVNCTSKEIVTTTTTTTTGSELNPERTAWIPTTPVVKISTSTRAADAVDVAACPDPGFAAGPPTSLARTGVELGWGLGIAGLLAALGAALILYPRIRMAAAAARQQL